MSLTIEGKTLKEAAPLILDHYQFRANVAILNDDTEVSLKDVVDPNIVKAIRVHECGDPHILYIPVHKGIVQKAVETEIAFGSS